jgi:ADP-ribose pyrophosphatase YjhB (NUDIX family)
VTRTDHYNDPNAPKPTSIVVAASAFVVDDDERLLMIRRTDSGLFALPGGRHELGETMTETAIRETLEETGVTIGIIGLIGIYSNPHHLLEFSDGEVRQEFSICFRGRAIEGTPRSSDESTDVDWISRQRIPELNIHPSILLRIEHGYAAGEPYYT